MTTGAVTFEDYRKIRATNWSSLKHLRESPLRFRFMQDAPDEDNAARAVGRAGHCALFEPESFKRLFFVLPEGAPDRPTDRMRNAKDPSRSSIERVKWWDEFERESAGRTMLTDEQWHQATGIAEAVRSHPMVAPYLEDGIFERAITWTDPQSGEPCKARIDWWARKKRALLDLKSSTSIDAHLFGRVASRLGYYCQKAHYYNGMIHGARERVDEVAIIVVEAKKPHDVAWFTVDDAALHAGQEEVAGLIRRLQECRRTSTWPGRYTEKQSLLLPQYIYGDEEIAVTEEV